MPKDTKNQETENQETEFDELLSSPQGNIASDLAAYRLAVDNGWTPVDAMRYFVSSPELKLAILLDLNDNKDLYNTDEG